MLLYYIFSLALYSGSIELGVQAFRYFQVSYRHFYIGIAILTVLFPTVLLVQVIFLVSMDVFMFDWGVYISYVFSATIIIIWSHVKWLNR